MKKILFQGDSVTDAWRDRENPADVDNGYVNLITSELEINVKQIIKHIFTKNTG